MADTSNTLRHRVLHIRPQTPASSAAGQRCYPFGELPAGLPLETLWCGEVYRGLALLLRPSSDPPQTVIVCLDGLGAAEFEFFSIVSRLRRDLKVYVYAAAHSQSRIARAVELGATGPVTRELLAELRGGLRISMTEEALLRASERVTEKLVSAVIAQHGHLRQGRMDHATPPSPPPEPPCIDEDDARKPARVPWLRYDDGPARVAPPHPEVPPQVLNPNLQTPIPPRSYEPLLTEEELRALMSDNIAAIVGDDPPSDARPVSRASTVPIDWPKDDDRARVAP